MKTLKPELVGLPITEVQPHCPACGNIGPDDCHCSVEAAGLAVAKRRKRVPLFDAAPNMLATLKVIVASWPDHGSETVNHIADAMVAKARVAIAEAEGI